MRTKSETLLFLLLFFLFWCIPITTKIFHESPENMMDQGEGAIGGAHLNDAIVVVTGCAVVFPSVLCSSRS